MRVSNTTEKFNFKYGSEPSLVFDTKEQILNFITSYGFKDRQRLSIIRYGKKWILRKE